jgi:hypothetical protein
MELFELIAGFRFQHLQLQQRHRTEIHVRTANLLDLPRRELDYVIRLYFLADTCLSCLRLSKSNPSSTKCCSALPGWPPAALAASRVREASGSAARNTRTT